MECETLTISIALYSENWSETIKFCMGKVEEYIKREKRFWAHWGNLVNTKL